MHLLRATLRFVYQLCSIIFLMDTGLASKATGLFSLGTETHINLDGMIG